MKYGKVIQRMLCLAVLLALCGGASAKEMRIAISCPYAPDGWDAAAAWSAEMTAEALGMSYMLKMASSAQEQAEDLELMVEQDYEYILLYPVDDAVETAARRAMKAGAVLLCFADVPGELEPDYSLTFDDAQLGALAADWLGEKLGGQGRVALVTLESDEAAAQRVAACRDALAEQYPEIEIAGTYAADDAAHDARMAEILAENPRLDGVYCCDASLATAMLRAIEAQGRLGDGGVQAMSCFGGSRAYLEMMDAYGDRIALAVQTASPCALGELVRACDGLAKGEGFEEAVLAPETVERANAAGWLLRSGITENAPF